MSSEFEKRMLNKTQVKIITYNIHSGFDTNMYPTLFDIINFLRIGEADVICLQEVNESAKAGFQVSSFKEELNMNAHFGANVVDLGVNYGLVTYSRYPIKKEEHIYLSGEKEQRGFLHTVINVKGKKVHIINVHLGLGDERKVQLEELVNFITELQDEHYIITGDFNQSDINIDDNLLTDVAREMGKSNLLTFPKGLERIDYVFVSKKIEIIDYEVPIKNMSDHYPIVVNIKI